MNLKAVFLICFALIYTLGYAQRPQDNLPPHITQITGFGERPDWSPESKKILFVGKVFGDVYEYDIETKFIRCVTLHFKHYGFTRAMYLSNGDILLSGPIEQYDMADRESRIKARHECWLSVLDKSLEKPPVSLGVKCSAGPAVSRHRLRIAWAELWRQNPQRLQEGESQIFVAYIVYEEGTPRLVDLKLVFDSRSMPFEMGSLEAQNFVPPNDKEITMSAYRIDKGTNTDGFILNLETSRGTL